MSWEWELRLKKEKACVRSSDDIVLLAENRYALQHMLDTVAQYANSSAATIPFTMSAMAGERGYARGDALLMTAAGAGLTGGSLVWGW